MNFAIGSVKFAPNKKLNNWFMILDKFFDGSDHFKHSELLIELRQEKSWKAWTKKLIDMKVNAHLQAFVNVTSAFVNL